MGYTNLVESLFVADGGALKDKAAGDDVKATVSTGIPDYHNAVAPQTFQKPEVSRESTEYQKLPYVDGAKTLLNGQVKPWSGTCTEVFSPIYLAETGERVPVGKQAAMSRTDALEAVNAASKAYAKGRGNWPKATLATRIQAVEGLVRKLKEIRSDIIAVLQWEICKNDADAAKEFDRTMDFIAALIEAATAMDATEAVCEEGLYALIKRSPVGVMMNLGPSNYPFNETYATLIPALLMGNCVVMKIPNAGGLAHVLTMEAYASCFPPGVVNFISGRGRDVMPPVMETGLVDILAFIGSSKAADAVIKSHPAPHRLKTLLSLDAKNLGVVMPDADLDVTVKECVAGSTSFNGQRCTALKLLMVHTSVVGAFNEKFCAAVNSLAAGTPFGKNSITPLGSSSTDFMKQLVMDAEKFGATVVNKSEGGGHWDRSIFFPAVVHPVTPEMKLWNEEQFGPVIPVAVYDSLSEVHDYLGKTHFGQQASIFTSQDAAATPSAELTGLLDACALSTCRVNINAQCQRGPDIFPFAGRRSSAMGTISVTEVLRAVSIETMVAAKKKELIARACEGSSVLGAKAA